MRDEEILELDDFLEINRQLELIASKLNGREFHKIFPEFDKISEIISKVIIMPRGGVKNEQET
jgi:hypothetical protein